MCELEYLWMQIMHILYFSIKNEWFWFKSIYMSDYFQPPQECLNAFFNLLSVFDSSQYITVLFSPAAEKIKM